MSLAEAVARYRNAVRVLDAARKRSTLVRRDPAATLTHWRKANQAALDAKAAWEQARDELVAAALNHHCEEAA